MECWDEGGENGEVDDQLSREIVSGGKKYITEQRNEIIQMEGRDGECYERYASLLERFKLLYWDLSDGVTRDNDI